MIAALALAALGALSSQATPEGAPAELPRPRAIGGIPGFRTVSELVYDSIPDERFELVSLHVFPGRARWHVKRRGGEPGERLIEFLHGESGFYLEPRSRDSIVLGAERVDDMRARVALRNALLVWPHGVDWEGEGELRTSPVVGTFALFGSEPEPLSFEAEVGGDGRPREVALVGEDAAPRMALRAIRWGEAGAPPLAMELWVRGGRVWTETLETFDTRVRYLDDFFLPPDRRDRPEVRAGVDRPRHVDAPPRIERRVELEPGLDWTGALLALAAAAEALERELAEPWSLERGGAFELDSKGRPVAGLLRLIGPAGEPPEGWTRTAESQSVAALLEDLEGVEATLPVLRDEVPRGARTRPPYVKVGRLEPSWRGAPVQLYLPLEAPR